MKDACPECGCCNHCNSRHEGSDHPLEACPLDPETPQEVVELYLKAAGCDPETGLKRIMDDISVLEKNRELAIELVTAKLKIGDLSKLLAKVPTTQTRCAPGTDRLTMYCLGCDRRVEEHFLEGPHNEDCWVHAVVMELRESEKTDG
jgi:hypothetical protein